MSLFKWNDSYSVGHTDIDNQHKRLFELADLLHNAMSSGKGKEVLSKTLTDLVGYTKYHFSSEEKLMQKCQYPEYNQHKQAHDELTAKVIEFQKAFETSRAVLTIDLMQFLRDWLQHHIGETDKKVASYLKQKAA